MTHHLVIIPIRGTDDENSKETALRVGKMFLNSLVSHDGRVEDSWATFDGDRSDPDIYEYYQDIKTAEDTDHPQVEMLRISEAYPWDMFATQLDMNPNEIDDKSDVDTDMLKKFVEGELDKVDEEWVEKAETEIPDISDAEIHVDTSPEEKWGNIPSIVRWDPNDDDFIEVVNKATRLLLPSGSVEDTQILPVPQDQTESPPIENAWFVVADIHV